MFRFPGRPALAAGTGQKIGHRVFYGATAERFGRLRDAFLAGSCTMRGGAPPPTQNGGQNPSKGHS